MIGPHSPHDDQDEPPLMAALRRREEDRLAEAPASSKPQMAAFLARLELGIVHVLAVGLPFVVVLNVALPSDTWIWIFWLAGATILAMSALAGHHERIARGKDPARWRR